MNAKKIFINTNPSLLNISILLLRCVAGVILFVAGSGKVLGWFGGMGLEKTIHIFVSNTGLVPALVYLSCFTEFIGGALLIIGLLTRPAAFAVTINMLVATSFMWSKGFFSGGAAYPFVIMIIALVILLAGPMDYSLDKFIFKSVNTKK